MEIAPVSCAYSLSRNTAQRYTKTMLPVDLRRAAPLLTNPRRSWLRIQHLSGFAKMAIKHLSVLLLGLPLLWLAGCERKDSLAAIEAKGKLVVVSRNGPSTYYLEKNEPTGFEYALASMLSEELGVEVIMQPAFTLNDIFQQLRDRHADIAAAGLTLTAQRASVFPHSVPYEDLITQVIYVAGTFRPRELVDLLGMDIVALADSSHAESLRAIERNKLPDLTWREIPEADTQVLLEMVNTGQADLAILDSNEFTVQQSLYPRLKVAFDLGTEQEMVWYLAPDTDNARLLATINGFFERLQQDGTLDRLRDIHFGHTGAVSRIGSHTFTLKMRKDLPTYQSLIQQVAREYQMDWRLLAAIAYQESHWNPRAASPTGVRGMMMLTRPTAQEMGVSNRLDAAQSLRGGARYLKNLLRRLPADITEPDRTWMALAAYNVGLGHLHDARQLTERQGGDPNLWSNVMQRLPLLQKSKFYKTLRYGYARGREAVTYVQNIRHYYSILTWQDIQEEQPIPPIDTNDYLPEALRGTGFYAL